jgi:2-dehydro-3-deoxygluconokinase
LLPLADVLIGVEVKSESVVPSLEEFKKAIILTAEAHPNLKVIATTMRQVKSATRNDWAGLCWAVGELEGKFYQSREYPNLEILDRIGGGDSFASGLIYGLMTSGDPQESVNLATAHGALAMTTPGDTSMASLADVRKLAEGGSARVER